MPRFAANLTMLWPELDVYDKFRAAAEAGFRRVEILFVHALDPARVERELREHRLELVLFDPAPGDWAKGERGLLSLPGREQEFLATLLVQAAGLTLLVEAINSIDMPGYFADTVEKAAALVEAAGSTAVRLQLDQYHVGMAGADARAALRRYAPLVAHVQIADVPGRNQPGTGSQPIREFLEDLDRIGYRESVGLEYRPRGRMDEALAWLPRPARE